MKKLPRWDYLKRRLHYDPVSGILLWKPRPREDFKRSNSFKNWNRRFAGKPAFISVDKDGYLKGKLDDSIYFASRIIWKLVTGEDPKKEVEHKNRKRADNRWFNLRLATHQQNSYNRNVAKNNKSGHTGVHFSSTERKWKAYLRHKCKRVSLGTHNSKKLAIAARKAGVKKYFGKFAP